MNDRCAVFAANRGFALTSSRLPLIEALQRNGWNVVAATAQDAEARVLARHGVTLERVDFERGGVAPSQDVRAFATLQRVYRRYRPQLVHHFHAKPVILGSLAAGRIPGRRVVVDTITGLGHAFGSRGALPALAGLGYRVALRRAHAVVFQNRDDRALFIGKGWVEESRSRLIVGSGVDTRRFAFATADTNPRRVMMVSRLLWQKGISEFVEVARVVRARMPEVRFQLVGELEGTHPDRIPASYIEQAAEEGAIEYLGYVRDVERMLRGAYLFLYPSRYREGVPRVILEAAASGVPAVGADVTGTREAIVEGETGFLVEPGSVRAFVDRVSFLLEQPGRRDELALRARARAEAEFDLRAITARQMGLYRELGLDVG